MTKVAKKQILFINFYNASGPYPLKHSDNSFVKARQYGNYFVNMIIVQCHVSQIVVLKFCSKQ